MKNKMKKIIVALMIATFLGSTSKSYAGETYAGRGALIGGLAVGTAAGIGGAVVVGDFQCGTHTTCDRSPSLSGGLIFGGLGGIVGAGIGALIGFAIPKHPKVSVAPIFIQSKTQGNTTGGSVAFRF